jgi:aminoglycoside 3-N-acetyltransferase
VNPDYIFQNIQDTYEAVGIKKSATVFVESDLASLGIYEEHKAQKICEDHFIALRELIGSEGLLIVPAFSTYLCNTDMPFDIDDSKSEMGMFSDYVRQLSGAMRTDHALTSYAGIGREPERICADASHLAYGPGSPMDHMINLDTWFISIGLRPHNTCSTVHQTELVMGAPYRYVKEFNHPVLRDGGIIYKYYYMHCQFTESKIEKHKKPLFDAFSKSSIVLESSLGRGKVYGYSMKAFYEFSLKYFKNNPYAILAKEPENKPYVSTL